VRRHVLLVAALSAAVFPAAAEAKIFLVFDRQAARPGETIRLSTPWTPARAVPVRAGDERQLLQAWLVRNEHARAGLRVSDRRLVRLGVVRLNDEYEGVRAFRLPSLAPGDYVPAFSLCNRGPARPKGFVRGWVDGWSCDSRVLAFRIGRSGAFGPQAKRMLLRVR
jgi:hypothetical protein